MNRNVLKIIATISMLIDHIGLFILNNNLGFRIVGRLAFPIFAFFVAEGMRHTKNRKKYILTLFIFALASQIPYVLLMGSYKLNILFTFLLAILFILLIEEYKQSIQKSEFLKGFLIASITVLLMITVAVIDVAYGLIDYSIWGVLLVLVFYFFKSKSRLIVGTIVILLMTFVNCLYLGFSEINACQIFAIISILLLCFYNNKKGNLNLKYFFYLFYPLHLWLIFIAQILMIV